MLSAESLNATHAIPFVWETLHKGFHATYQKEEGGDSHGRFLLIYLIDTWNKRRIKLILVLYALVSVLSLGEHLYLQYSYCDCEFRKRKDVASE